MELFDINKIIITTQKSFFDIDAIMVFLNNHSYWAGSRKTETMKKAIDNSLCWAVLYNGKTIGFARVVTDYSTVYYLCDVFVIPEFQNRGIGSRLLETVFNSEELDGLNGILRTRDGHNLYKKYGFKNDQEIKDRFMFKRY